ncbi:ROK family protein [Actinocatenispora rupis]|uniref:Glucokinase n=1 Tax=Actinocatenispora rupis TaxID=519421 RepID=A0A8J3J0F3_9ACTN|nr:ROK family protein [Actinocatenispora rupis]GID13496.1 glucokinase [Actinocatenispora rupis]
MSLTIGVDVGGTKVAAAVVEEDGSVLAQTRRHTPADDVSQTLQMIMDAVEELVTAHDVEAIGIGAAGWIDAARSTVLFAPNIAWRNEPLQAELADKFGLPVVVENDANVAAWAEYRFGAGRDVESMLMYTVGTGIGGAVIMDGRLIRGAHGIAAELGHLIAVPDGQICGCGRRGCLEQYASGQALVRLGQAAVAHDPDSAPILGELAGGVPSAVTGPMITDAARRGDTASVGALADIGKWLGIACVDLVQALDPQVIVIGGGVVDAGDLLLDPTRASYAAGMAQRGRLPVAELRPAEMGNTAGVVGAADLARSR